MKSPFQKKAKATDYGMGVHTIDKIKLQAYEKQDNTIDYGCRYGLKIR